MDAMEKKRYLTAMGRSVENMTVEELKEVDTAALAKEHAEKANKKKEGKYDVVCSSVFSFCAHLS
jgi:hypothetical protein